jgi:hypothetical protein
MRRFAAIELSV